MGLGFVCFASVGPGDGRLRTERAAERIAEADLVVADDDPVSAERLVELAREGKRVVRAVAGDALESPSVVAQAMAVAGAGVPIEVVPGVGARAAAAAFAGVCARAVRVATSEVQRAVEGEPDRALTILVAAGSPSQRVIVTTAATAPARARELDVESVILAFGVPEQALRWFEHRPLFGKRVLVTRAREQAGSTAALLREHGAEPLVVPTIEIRPPRDPAGLARALMELRRGAYAWVAFTSANGVERTWAALVASGHDARAFGSARLAAIGPATARALDQHGLRADIVAKEFRGERLAEELLEAVLASGESQRVLIPRAARAREVLPEALRAAGCKVDVVAAYETHPPPRETVLNLVRELEVGHVDAVTFTSSSTVDNLCDLLGPRAAELLGSGRIASIGPVTTDTARARGLRVDLTAREYTVQGLVRALAESYAQ